MSKAPADIRSLARTHTEEAIEKLVFWMRSDNARASVSATATILERGWGKAAQAIIGGDEDDPAVKVIQRIERVIVNAPDRNG